MLCYCYFKSFAGQAVRFLLQTVLYSTSNCKCIGPIQSFQSQFAVNMLPVVGGQISIFDQLAIPIQPEPRDHQRHDNSTTTQGKHAVVVGMYPIQERTTRWLRLKGHLLQASMMEQVPDKTAILAVSLQPSARKQFQKGNVEALLPTKMPS